MSIKNIKGVLILFLVIFMLNSVFAHSSEELGSFKDNVKENKNKLNTQTYDYLNKVNDLDDSKKYIIKFRSEINENKLKDSKIEKNIGRYKISKVSAKAGNLDKILSDEDIEYIELDQQLNVLADFIPENIEAVKADTIWNFSKGDGIKIAILDTGINAHDDLSIAGATTYIDDDYTDYDGHGTAVAGVISALINDEGLIGVAPEVDIYSVKIMENGIGELSDAIDSVSWAIDNNMDIVSMSFGFNSYSQIFKEVLEEAYSSGILLVAASGNEGGFDILYPAKYSSVIAVGAVDSSNNLATFSSYGLEQELVAPGVEINSTSLNNDYSVGSGTSLAAPHVSGVAALIWSYNNSLSNIEVRSKLRNDAVDLGVSGRDDYYGFGLVQSDLEDWGFPEFNDSYYYEIFNISNYRMYNEEYTFWVSGTGTVDDVSFEEGYYLVNITLSDGGIRSYVFDVKENGTLIPLSDYLDFDDDYTFNCSGSCTDDGVVMKDGSLDVEIYESDETIRAECFDWDDDGYTDECFGSQSYIDDCVDDYDGNYNRFRDWCEETSPQCTSSGSVGEHIISTSISKAKDMDSIFCYYDSSLGMWRSDPQADKNYYICDKRQYICSSGNQYNDVCKIVIGEDLILETYTCGENYYCDSDEDGDNADFGTYGTTLPSNPCRLNNVCSGTINVVTTDTDLKVYMDSSYEDDTGDDYSVIKSLSDETCGEDFLVEVKCSDNTVCYTETAYLNYDNEIITVVDSDCSLTCSGEENIWFTNKDVEVNGNDINITYHSADFSGNVDIKLQKISRETGLISEEHTISSSIGSKTIKSEIYSGFDLTDASGLNIYLEASDGDKDDNYVYRVISQDTPKAFLSINTSYPKIDSLIKTYLKQYVDYKDNVNDAELIISVGKFTEEFEIGNQQTLLGGMYSKVPDWGYNKKIYAFGDSDSSSYAGIVGRTYYSETSPTKSLILAYGNELDGDIAALKKLVSARNLFFSDLNNWEKSPVLMDKYDKLALGINNLLPTDTKKNSSGYLKAVNKILFDNIYDVAIRPVKTLSTTSYSNYSILRVKNVNADYTDDFKDAISESDKPVVFSGGIFSNLESWESNGKGLARELASDGYDTWEIEMTGGPQIENEECCNYTYQDLVDYYWPALIAGVQAYTSQNSVDYIGHSNGGRVALSSLNSYSSGKSNAGYYFNYSTGMYELTDLENNPVDIYVGVAVPSVLNGEADLTRAARTVLCTSYDYCYPPAGDRAISKIESKGLLHIKKHDYVKYIALYNSPTIINYYLTLTSAFEAEKISTNVMKYYNNLSVDDNSNIVLNDVDVNKLYLFNTKPHDIIVPFEDQQVILDVTTSISSNDKEGTLYEGLLAELIYNHGQIYQRKFVKDDIKEVLQ